MNPSAKEASFLQMIIKYSNGACPVDKRWHTATGLLLSNWIIGHSVWTFCNVDAAICEYAQVFPHKLAPLAPELQLSDFYTSSDDQKNHEMHFVIKGIAVTGFVAYKLAKHQH